MSKQIEIGQGRPLAGEVEVGSAERARPTHGKSGRTLGFVVLCLLLAGAGVWAFRKRAASAAGPRAAGLAAAGSIPVPVLAGTVTRKDVPIYLDGLGTVQA